MKMLFVLALLSTTVMAAEVPSWGTSVDPETKMVTLNVYNNDSSEVHCKYSVSYVVNVTTYKKQFGTIVLAPQAQAAISYLNDSVDHISRVRANVSCE